jgi:hypothetical protein
MREMRAVSFVTRLVTQNCIVDEKLPHVLIHSIADDEFMGALSSTSKYNADWESHFSSRPGAWICGRLAREKLRQTGRRVVASMDVPLTPGILVVA